MVLFFLLLFSHTLTYISPPSIYQDLPPVKLLSPIYFTCCISKNRGIPWRGWRDVFVWGLESESKRVSGGVWESVEETVAGWHSQQPNSPPVTTSKTTPTWCRITNRDKKDGRWLNLCKGMELCARVCGYNGKGGASERRETEGIKRIMTPSHDYLCLPLWPPMPITEIRHPVPVCVHTHKCVYFSFYGAKCAWRSHTGICIHCLISVATHFLFPTALAPVPEGCAASASTTG